MAQDINSWTGTGRLTRDADLTYTQKQTAILKFSIASNRYKGGDGVDKEAVSFIDCQVWGKQATALSPYLKKGSQVGVTGELIQERWTDKEQKIRQKFTINASKILLIGKKGDGSQQAPPQDNKQEPSNIEFQDFDKNTLGDDEVPF